MFEMSKNAHFGSPKRLTSDETIFHFFAQYREGPMLCRSEEKNQKSNLPNFFNLRSKLEGKFFDTFLFVRICSAL